MALNSKIDKNGSILRYFLKESEGTDNFYVKS